MPVSKETKSFLELTNQRLAITSRLRLANILKDHENETFMNFFRSYDIVDVVQNRDSFYHIHNAEESEWWDNISFKYYETPSLWWLICFMNDTVNPYEEIEEGQQIKVLKQTYLYIIFKNIGQISQL